MTSIFIDTTAFRSLFDPRDACAKKAAGILRRLPKTAKLITTDYIIDETYTGLLTRSGYKYALIFDQAFIKGDWQIEWISPQRFIRTQDVFRRYNKDKVWSFTDCSSFVVIKELKIPAAFSFDKNFRQMGIKIL